MRRESAAAIAPSRMSIVEVSIALIGMASLVAVQLGLLFTRPGNENFWASLAGVTVLLAIPLVRACIKRQFDPLEPVYIVAIAYFLYFVLAPATNLLSREDYFFGRVVTPLVPLGSLYLAVGLVAMWLGYYSRGVGKRVANALPRPTAVRVGAVKYAVVLGVVGLILFGVYVKMAGLSWIQLLSLGQAQDATALQAGAGGGESAFRNYLYSTVDWLMVAFMVFYAFSSRGRRWLIPIFICLLLIYTTIGFRYRVLILVIAPVIYWYLERRRRPGVVAIATAAFCSTVIIGVIGHTRNNFRSGTAIQPTELSMSSAVESFTRALDIYQPYLVIISDFPSKHEFLWGSSFAYLLVHPIPRRLWPEKPDAPVRAIVDAVLGNDAVDAGVAYPNIGEFYANFGALGIVVGMWLFGALMSGLYQYLQKYENNDWARVVYALSVPFLIQVVSRGYFVAIVQEAAFLIGPVFFGMWLVARRGRSRQRVPLMADHPRLEADR